MSKTAPQRPIQQHIRIPIGRIVLGLIVVAGIIPLVAVAPGLGYAFKQFGVTKRLHNRAYVSTVLSRLKRDGYIVFEEHDGRHYVCITKAGKQHLQKRRTVLFSRPRKRRWDRYWRIVMFDIPERQRGLRNVLRRELAEVGFKKLQWSVWVSPDECEEYVKLLKADQHIGKRLIYLKTKDIEYGTALKALFSITKS